MSSDAEQIDREKDALRATLRTRRRAVHATGHLAAATALSDRFFDYFGDTLAGKTVAAYWPMKDEIDVRPVLDGLSAHAATSALPVMAGNDQPMSFRRWAPGDRLVSAAFGVSEPDPGQPEVDPDIVIVPLLGFDAAGNRIGYGGGYYDRTLAALRERRDLQAVGVAYDQQQCEKIPTDAGDMALDVLITDQRTILPRKDESTD